MVNGDVIEISGGGRHHPACDPCKEHSADDPQTPAGHSHQQAFHQKQPADLLGQHAQRPENPDFPSPPENRERHCVVNEKQPHQQCHRAQRSNIEPKSAGHPFDLSRPVLGPLDKETSGKALLNTRDDLLDCPRGV